MTKCITKFCFIVILITKSYILSMKTYVLIKKNYLPRFTLTKIQQFKDSGICFGRHLDFDPLK